MKSQSYQFSALPNVTTGANSTIAVDVSAGMLGFAVQFVGIASTGATFAIMGSLDGGTTFVDITASFANIVTPNTLTTSPVTADSIYLSRAMPFPGLVQIKCTHVSSSTAVAGYINFQDSRTV